MLRRQALLVPLLSLLGLVTGFGREVVLAALYGTSPEIEIFRIAFGLPTVLADGAAVSVVSVLVPFVVATRAGMSASRLGVAVGTMGAMAVVLGLVGVATMPLQATLLGPGFTGAERDALIFVGRICWGGFALATLTLPLRGMLAARGAVWPGAGLQLMRSGGFVAILLLGLAVWGAGLAALALAALGASVVVLAIHVIALGPRGRRMLGHGIARRLKGDRALALALASVMLSQMLLAGGRLMDRAVASGMEQGTVAALEFSYGLLMAMAALIGTTASLFVAPYVTRALREGRGIARSVWLRVGALTGAAAVGGVLTAALALPIVRLVFGYGAFGADDARLTAGLFRIHALGLAPVVAALVLTQFVLSLGGPRIILWIAGGKLVLKGAVLAAFLALGLGADALTLSLLVAETGMTLALAGYLVRRRASFSGPASG